MNVTKKENGGAELAEFDILDHLPEEVGAAVDRLGYDLLQSNGYHTRGADSSKKILRRLERDLKRNGHVLEYCTRPGAETGTVLLFFRLLDREGAELGRSQTMKIVLGNPEKGNRVEK